jgi:RNA polymerase sigma factor (sigma-70 family)
MTQEDALTGVLDRLAVAPSDEDAWRSLYLQLWPFVIGVIHRRLRGNVRGAAEDAAQEVFIRLLRSRPFQNIRNADAFRGYVWKIADNVAKTHLQKIRKKDDSERAVAELDGNDRTFGPVEPNEQFVVEEALGAIQGQLEPQDNELLSLLLEGQNLGQVAGRLGVSYSTAGVRLHRLRKKLHNMLNLHTN